MNMFKEDSMTCVRRDVGLINYDVLNVHAVASLNAACGRVYEVNDGHVSAVGWD